MNRLAMFFPIVLFVGVLTSAALPGRGQPPVCTLGPYAVAHGNNILLLWHVSAPCSAVVEYRTSSSARTVDAVAGEQDPLKMNAMLTGLTSGRLYEYSLKVGEETLAVGSFWSRPARNSSGTLVILSDTQIVYPSIIGTSPIGHLRLDQNLPIRFAETCLRMSEFVDSRSNNPIGLIHVGDLVNNGNSLLEWEMLFGANEFQRVLSRVPIIAAGNGGHTPYNSLYRSYLPFPRGSDPFWSLDYGPLRIVVVDADYSYGFYTGDPELMDRVRDALSGSDLPWRIMIMFRPVLPRYMYDEIGNNANKDHSIGISEAFQWVIEEKAADIVIGGDWRCFLSYPWEGGMTIIAPSGVGFPAHLFTSDPKCQHSFLSMSFSPTELNIELHTADPNHNVSRFVHRITK